MTFSGTHDFSSSKTIATPNWNGRTSPVPGGPGSLLPKIDYQKVTIVCAASPINQMRSLRDWWTSDGPLQQTKKTALPFSTNLLESWTFVGDRQTGISPRSISPRNHAKAQTTGILLTIFWPSRSLFRRAATGMPFRFPRTVCVAPDAGAFWSIRAN